MLCPLYSPEDKLFRYRDSIGQRVSHGERRRYGGGCGASCAMAVAGVEFWQGVGVDGGIFEEESVCHRVACGMSAFQEEGGVAGVYEMPPCRLELCGRCDGEVREPFCLGDVGRDECADRKEEPFCRLHAVCLHQRCA